MNREILAAAAVHLRLLGTAAIEDDRTASQINPGRKALALLAFLALAPGFRASRDKLADLLWPDRPNTQSRNNLRQLLSVIRKAGPLGAAGLIDTGRDWLALRPDAFRCDALDLIAACQDTAWTEDSRRIADYPGPFLDGFHSGSDAFDGWAALQRDRIGALVARAMQERIRTADPDLAAILLRKALEIDPTREETYRIGMDLFAGIRQREQALRLYDSCKAMLAREFGVSPSAETELARDRILAGQSPLAGHPDEVPAGDGPGSLHHRKRLLVQLFGFENVSGERSHELFLRALSESLSAELAQVHEVDLVSLAERTDRTAARAPGLSLTGTLISFGARLQLAVRLIEEPSGKTVSVERFLFASGDHIDQIDQIAECIALATKFECLHARWRMRDVTPADDFQVRLLILKAHCRYYELTGASLTEAIDLSERALALCPTSLRARRMLALALTGALVQGVLPHDPATVARALALAEDVARAVPEDVFSRCVLAWALGQDGQHEAAIEHLKFALRRNPEFATLHSDLAEHYALLGYTNEALAEVEEAIRLSGEDVVSFWRHYIAALAQYAAGNYAATVASTRRALRDKPGLRRGSILLAAAAAALGLDSEANQAIRLLLAERPELNQRNILPKAMPRFRREDLNQRLLAHLAAAGLPE